MTDKVTSTLAERGSRYGQFADHARIAQGIQDVMRAAPKWNQLDLDMKQALSVIADKIARILNGDPFYGDNWHDIQGYAKLIEDRIAMIEPKQEDTLYEEEERKGAVEKAVQSWRDSEKRLNTVRGLEPLDLSKFPVGSIGGAVRGELNKTYVVGQRCADQTRLVNDGFTRNEKGEVIGGKGGGGYYD